MSQHLLVSLTTQQRHDLIQQVRSGVHPTRVLTRARILLLADRSQGERHTHKQIAQAIQVCEMTVSNICRRFVLAQQAGQDGLDAALTEKPRPGKAPKITGEVEAHLVLLACSQPPAGCARWTMQLLADKLIELELVESITDTTVCERLKKTRSSPGGLNGFV